jgi:hypothetical protein
MKSRARLADAPSYESKVRFARRESKPAKYGKGIDEQRCKSGPYGLSKLRVGTARTLGVPQIIPREQTQGPKPATPSKVNKPGKQKTTARFRARWGILASALKRAAVYDHKQRGAPDERAADLLARKKGG